MVSCGTRQPDGFSVSNARMSESAPHYVTCCCQHCDGHIEFDSSGFEEGETRTTLCPHCELETALSVPAKREPPMIPPASPPDETDLDSLEDDAFVFKWWRRAAEQGYPEYQAKWAVVLACGLGGVAQDFAEAAEWFRKAAEQGHVTAQYNLAVCYWDGLGVTKDHSEVVKWLLKAAEQGHAEAQFNLGASYWNGHGLAKDHTEGVRWLLKAAEQGHAGAQRALGACYKEGDGVGQNLVEAHKWAKLAAAQNEEGAQKRCDELASKMSQDQLAESQAHTEAFKRTTAANTVSELHQESFMDLWRRLAEDGDIEAQQLLAARCENIIEAMKWVRKSAEQGSCLAQYRLGAAHVAGEGVRQDFPEAVRWLRKAAEKQFVPAMYELGLAFYRGLGVPQNYVEAYKFASIAAARGLPNARTLRDEVAEKMSPRQIAQGQRLATEKGERGSGRDAIPSEVRREVWRRDNGQCVKCGSREKLEYDHIIPISKGGSNTARNIELLCEACNRSKGDLIR
jgi:TPR repeat protein